jgi:hypothetical protein
VSDLATVTAIGVERSRRIHPSMQPAAPTAMTLTARQLVATLIQRLYHDEYVSASDVRNAIDLLLGVDDGGAA